MATTTDIPIPSTNRRSPDAAGANWPVLALKLAWRDLRSGVSGFYVFLACVALGVAAITAVGVFTDTVQKSFLSQGRGFLGGDVAASLIHRPANAEQKAWFAQRGRVSEVATLRAMARTTNGENQSLIELKAVDDAYPLIGDVTLRDESRTFRQALAQPKTVIIDNRLIEQLGVEVGDTIKVGDSDVKIAGILKDEPDKFSGRPAFGPRVLMTLATLKASGLDAPGGLIRWRYRIAYPDADAKADAARGEVETFAAQLKDAFPRAGFSVLDRRNPSPGVTRAIERFAQFLSLVGLTALMVGGVGIANAIATFIDRKRKSIATFKSLGAPSKLILGTFFAEALLLAVFGTMLGLIIGFAIPALILAIFGSALPIELSLSARPSTLLAACGYGILVTIVFVLWPLGRAQRVKATVLFRDVEDKSSSWPGWPLALATLAAVLGLAAFAIVTAYSPLIATMFCLGLAVIFPVFFGLGWFIRWSASKLPRPRNPELALALSNMSGPGSLARSVVLSLGVGLTLLISIGLIDRSITGDLATQLPDDAPSYFFLDIRKDEIDGFEKAITSVVPEAELVRAPMLRGRITALKGSAPNVKDAPEDVQWVLRGDRGLTFAATPPENARIIEGSWWEKDYSGPPLVSVEADAARGLGLKLGDTITVNVLGREITATVANLRTVKWESLAINFVLVFSPNTLAAAPFNIVATLALPDGTTDKTEGLLMRQLTNEYPTVTSIRVRDAIEAVSGLITRILMAVRGAGGITLLAGAIVLAGALATSQRRRIYQSVILKAIGATRARLIRTHMFEYAALALATSLVAVLLGSLVAYVLLTQFIDLTFVFDWKTVLQIIGLAMTLVLVFGAVGTWRVLSAPSVPYLKSE